MGAARQLRLLTPSDGVLTIMVYRFGYALPYGIAFWSNCERYVYLSIDGKNVPFAVTYHDAGLTDCTITVEGVDYRFQT